MFNDNAGNIAGRAKIKVIGVGGAGNNAVNRMIEAGIMCADYYVVNTDSQILALSPCENKIQIGGALTKGLGAGAEPDVGRMAAEESKDELTEAVKDTDLHHGRYGRRHGHGRGSRNCKNCARHEDSHRCGGDRTVCLRGQKAYGKHRKGPRKS